MSSMNSGEGIYVYCIVNSDDETDFGEMGIEDSLVYTLPVKNLGVVVHRCEAELYKTKDKGKAAEWFLTHQLIVDQATKQFGTVIPQSFNTIFAGEKEVVEKWINQHYNQLKMLLEKLEGRQQYEVQIFLDTESIRKKGERNGGTRRVRKEIKNNSGGAAYLFKKRREKNSPLIKNHTAKFYNKIKDLVDEVRFEPLNKRVPEKWQEKLMILNLSCLAHKDRVGKLGNMLGEVNKREGFTVRLTGPWPPYSFVGAEKIQKMRR